jgi:transcriptional regulator with XRE-family HTH domain
MTRRWTVPTSAGLSDKRKTPTIDLLDRLAGTLGVPLAEFFMQPARGAPVPKALPKGRKVAHPKRKKP